MSKVLVYRKMMEKPVWAVMRVLYSTDKKFLVLSVSGACL